MMNKILTSLIAWGMGMTISAQTIVQGGPQCELPTMGWSSWNTYHVNISDSLIMRQADAMVSEGLKDAGYTYVNIDDGYFGGRDATTGRMLCHPTRFPHGLKPVADHIHSLGLKAGIYSDAGSNTCGSYYDNDSIAIGVGLYGHDQQDCDMFFRELGFDFIKVDFCGGSAHQNTDHLSLSPRERYTAISKAIRQTGRHDVRLNVCRWNYPGTWVGKVASSWRMSHDISDRWSSLKDIIEQNLYLSAYASPGHYNDMDMLEVGRRLTAYQELANPLAVGTAYYDEDKTCRGEMKVANLGLRPENDLQWRDVYCQEDGDYTLRIHTTGIDEKQSLYVAANGGRGYYFTREDAEKDGTVTLTVRLHKGFNTLRLYNDHAPMPDVDYLEVVQN